MKRLLTTTALSLALALCALAPAALAKGRKPSAAHKSAVAKCRADYKMAVKDARTKKGRERQEALAAAKKAEKECIAAAPQ